MDKFIKDCNYHINFESKDNSHFNGVAFLDRDGVVIKEKVYIKDPKDVELNPGINRLIKYLNSLNYKIIIITNQSGINRGYFDWEDYFRVTKRMLDLLDDEIKINSLYACGSHNMKICNWRKPGTGMIYQGWTKELILEKDSILIGDKSTDIEAGINANLRNLFHVLTGHGEEEKEKVINLIRDSDYNFEKTRFQEKGFFQSKNLDFLYKQILSLNNY